MSVDDVTDILAIPLLGAIPDDEQVVIGTNQGNRLSVFTPGQEKPIQIFADVLWEKQFHFLIWKQKTVFFKALRAFQKRIEVLKC